MRPLIVIGAALLGAAAGIAAVVLIVFACTTVLGPSDVGLWLLVPALLGATVAGVWAGILLASRGTRPPGGPGNS